MQGIALQALTIAPLVFGVIGKIRRDQKKRVILAAQLGGLDIYRGRGKAMHMRGPKALDKYYTPCMTRYRNKEYCARVAWKIYCSHVNPKYPGCSRRRGYSGPLSRRGSLRGFEGPESMHNLEYERTVNRGAMAYMKKDLHEARDWLLRAHQEARWGSDAETRKRKLQDVIDRIDTMMLWSIEPADVEEEESELII